MTAIDILTHRPAESIWLVERLGARGFGVRICTEVSDVTNPYVLLYKYGRIVTGVDFETIRESHPMNLHNSLLPEFRGLHAFSWAISEGRSSLGYSLHTLTEEVDTGDIFGQVSFALGSEKDINDAQEIGQLVLNDWLPQMIELIVSGNLDPYPQEVVPRVYPWRGDSNTLTTSMTIEQARNLMRAVAPPYGPGVRLDPRFGVDESRRLMLPLSRSSQRWLSERDHSRFSVPLADGSLWAISYSEGSIP